MAFEGIVPAGVSRDGAAVRFECELPDDARSWVPEGMAVFTLTEEETEPLEWANCLRLVGSRVSVDLGLTKSGGRWTMRFNPLFPEAA